MNRIINYSLKKSQSYYLKNMVCWYHISFLYYCHYNDSNNNNVDNIATVNNIKKTTNKAVFQLIDSDLVEKFIKGGGNGGQSINKTSNMVQLKHIPSGIVIECQKTRELQSNRKIARKILRDKLEFLSYGDDSKIGKKILKIQRTKSKSRSRALKKYHKKDNNDNEEKK